MYTYVTVYEKTAGHYGIGFFDTVL